MKKNLFLMAMCGILIFIGAGCDYAKPIVKQEIVPASEGKACGLEITCQQGLKCLKNICSSGKVGSACETYKDCQSGLYCVKSICANPPSYSQYFNKIVISKMKLGMPPGPNNMPIAATEFKTTDAIEIDFNGVKSATKGEIYYEAIDLITGEVAFTSSSYKQKLEGRDTGTGSDLPRVVGKGDFDLNIYYNNELVFTTAIKVTD
jgi:hypothetical protein